MAEVLVDRGEPRAAELPARRAVALASGEGDYALARWRATAVLAKSLVGQARFDESEALLLGLLPEVESLGIARRHVLDLLTTLYEAWGREGEAAHYRALGTSSQA